jgi:kynurenine formamidase
MLPPGYGITAEDCLRAQELEGVAVRPKDTVLLRTGYMVGWPEEVKLASCVGAGVGLAAARWLAERGAVVVGTDNPNFEQNPSADPDMPRVVHPFLLIERGIPIIELAFLEELARDKIWSFAFMAAPLKIRGGTASMIRPLAVV